MAEGAAFEMRSAGNRSGGSNPSLSVPSCSAESGFKPTVKSAKRRDLHAGQRNESCGQAASRIPSHSNRVTHTRVAQLHRIKLLTKARYTNTPTNDKFIHLD